jgi:hypothetical protein
LVLDKRSENRLSLLLRVGTAAAAAAAGGGTLEKALPYGHGSLMKLVLASARIKLSKNS